MSSRNNYAERTTKRVLADLEKIKRFHFDVTTVNDRNWGRGGMDFDRLENSDSVVNFDAAEHFLKASDAVHEVFYGYGTYGWCFEVSGLYFWLAPVREVDKTNDKG